MLRSKEEIMESAKTLFGDRNDDEVISFYEDLTDSYNDNANEVETVKAEYEQKLSDLDKEWRDKYTQRFFEGGTDKNDDVIENPDATETVELKTTYEELFG